jgi:putative acetyltransferase
MDFSTDYTAHTDAITQLFHSAFTTSEGAEEGALISDLARRIMLETSAEDLRVLTAWQDGTIVGGAFFTRLVYPEDRRSVFLIAPVAVAPERQGQGIGQLLLRRGLDALRQEGVGIAVTYGDPSFYGRVGFKAMSQTDMAAPQPLQQPQGWIGLSLTRQPLTPVRGPCRCVAAFDDPAFW